MTEEARLKSDYSFSTTLILACILVAENELSLSLDAELAAISAALLASLLALSTFFKASEEEIS